METSSHPAPQDSGTNEQGPQRMAPSSPKDVDDRSPKTHAQRHPYEGGQGGRGGRLGGDRGHKKRDMGRGEWSRNTVDKRTRNDRSQQANKRQRVDGEERNLPIYATRYNEDEIAGEERRPKRKVAVMIGYAGSGYKGMQLSHEEKTIEGDLFRAFVAAGAISKANADDPKKSSLVRCARTDKGVHAAGNVISLKLIVEDDNVVSKINEALAPQIRVWGIERMNGGFSSYQMCDSRIYEYLIPSYCFIPPDPKSFLGEEMLKIAEEENDLEGYRQRQEDVADFWAEIAGSCVQKEAEVLEPHLQEQMLNLFHGRSTGQTLSEASCSKPESSEPSNDAPAELDSRHAPVSQDLQEQEEQATVGRSESGPVAASSTIDPSTNKKPRPLSDSELVQRALRTALHNAKRAWRIPPSRLERLRSTLSRFVGSHKFHNHTIDKTARDPSAIRVIKSFIVDPKPVIIGGTEWLSLKVHGQSFMMHQIRKMVSAATLIVRCGCHEGRIQDTYLPDRLNIPKAPSLGLLLERPVFDKQNEKLAEFGRGKIDFGKYESEIAEFKQREIYERIFGVEERDGVFLAFWAGLDTTKTAGLLWASSAGVKATKREIVGAVMGGKAEKETGVGYEEEDEHGAQDEN